jgi:hypothetical protein
VPRDLRKRGYGPGKPLLVSVDEELEIVPLEELEIVPFFDPPEIWGDPVVEVISGAGVAPACVGPASGNAGSFVRIRIRSNDVVPRWLRSPNPPSRRIPLNEKLAMNEPPTVIEMVVPLKVRPST